MSLKLEENKFGEEFSNESRNTNEWEPELIHRLELNLKKIEKMLLEKIESLERAISLGPQNEICPKEPPFNLDSVSKTISRIELALKRHSRAEEISLKRIKDLEKQLNEHKLILQEIQMERDVLLERVHSYLEINSSLKIRLEEQRCFSEALQRHRTPGLENEDETLRVDDKRLGDLNIRKSAEIDEMNAVLQETKKSLEHGQTEASNCKNAFSKNLFVILKRGFQKTLKENARFEEKSRKLLIKDRLIGEKICEPDFVERKTKVLKRFKSMTNLGPITLPLKSFQLLYFNPSAYAALPATCKNHQCSQPNRWKSKPELDISEKFSSSTLSESLECFPLNQEPNIRKQVFIYSCQRTHQAENDLQEINSNETLNSELNTIRYDLENLTLKLKAVKIQLINLQLSEDTINETGEYCMMRKTLDAPFNLTLNKQTLKDTLEEAKHLNAKLQNMKTEKQKQLFL